MTDDQECSCEQFSHIRVITVFVLSLASISAYSLLTSTCVSGPTQGDGQALALSTNIKTYLNHSSLLNKLLSKMFKFSLDRIWFYSILLFPIANSGWIRTCERKFASQLFYHCATAGDKVCNSLDCCSI